MAGPRLSASSFSSQLPNTLEGRLTSVGSLNYAEAIAVGIFQHDKVSIRAVFLRVTGRPDPDQPLHLALLVGRVEVQVHPAGFAEGLKGLRNPVEGHVGAPPLGIAEDHPAVLRRLPWYVMERFPPERHHLVELVAPDDDRTDLHLPFLHTRPAPTEKKNIADRSLPLASTS